MSKRAPRGAGTVAKRVDGRYHAAINVLTPTGERKRIYVYTDTREEAEEARRALMDNNRAGIPSTWSELTLADYLEYWGGEVAARASSPSTRSRNDALARDHIIPHLGPTRLNRLTVGDVRRLTRTLREKSGRRGRPLSLRTRQSVHAVLSSALQHAVHEGLIGHNVASSVPSPVA